MKMLICLTLIMLCAAGSSRGAEKVLQRWDFTKAKDTLGWTNASGMTGFGVREGAMSGTLASDILRLVSPLFEFKATPLQYVEVELKTDANGTGQMFYSDTTEEPYGGFRPNLLTNFEVVGDGKFHTYVIRPFWQGQGKIIHIRIDPPGRNFAVRRVSIVEPDAGAAVKADSWEFAGSARGWAAKGEADQVEVTGAGLRITGNRNTQVLSPPLDMDPSAYPWVTIRISSITQQTVEFNWVGSESGGLKGVPIQLKADGKPHNYAIPLGEIANWSGRIAAFCIVPTQSSEPQSMVLESVRLGATPLGPAELQVKSVALEDPYPRVGDPVSKVIVEVVNIGGTALKHVKAEIAITGQEESRVAEVRTVTNNTTGKQNRETTTSTGKWKITFSGEIGDLAPGQTGIPGEWKMAGTSAGTATVVCTVRADGVEPTSYTTTWRFYPKLDPKAVAGLKYVPAPKPADTGDYLVGCYNFPGWRDYGAWSVLDAFPERKPLLGYYHDGNPEVNDWQITWALDHGINFLIYDWYWQKGRRQLEEGLHDGFFKARYNEKMKFCLLWANHNAAGTSSYDDMINVTKYWIENYFNRPNYLKLGGKNVMVIFAPQRFTEDMGKDEVKRAFADMKKLCEAEGAGGLYMVACAWPNADMIRTMEYEGYDALGGYNYPSAGDRGQLVAPYSWMVDGYKDIWEQITKVATLPYIPLCEAGWDSRPWHGAQARVRAGKTPELWQNMLSNAKAYDDDPKHKLPEGKKLVFLEAWNEYGEGDYIEPHREFGFDYLEAVRKVFAPKSEPPVIVLPRDIGLGPYDIAKPVETSSWDFGSAKDQTWTCDGGHAAVTYASGVLHADIKSTDAAFYSPPVKIDASKHKTLELKMKMDVSDTAQLFFASSRSGFSEEKSVKFPTFGDNEFHVYTVDLGSNPLWRGTIGGLRFDPNSQTGSKVEVAYIRVRE